MNKMLSSIFGIPLSTANAIYTISNLILVIGALCVLVGTIGSVFSAGIRERFSDERIARNEADTATANARAAEADQRAAEANARTAEAELRLERLRKQVSPRQIDHNKFLAALEGQPKARVEVLFLRDDADSFLLAQQIWQLFTDAKWDVTPPAPVQPSDLYPTSPTVTSAGGQPSGVTVVAHSVSFEESEWWGNKMRGREWTRTPWTVVSSALSESLGSIAGSGGGPNSPPDGTLRIVVAPRL